MSKISLLDACNITTGKLDSNAAIENGKYPYFTCAPEPLRIDKYEFDGDVILLAGNNASGNFHCQRYKGKFNAYQRTYVITVKEGYDIDYIFYNIKINLQHFKKISQGSQTKFLTMQILERFLIEDLPIEKQRKMVRILTLLDQKIESNSKVIQELENIIKTTYEYWFMQFEFPDSNGEPYKLAKGKLEHNKKVNRKIPARWKVGEVKGLVEFVSGYPFSSEDYDEAGVYKIYTIKNVQDGSIISKVDNHIKNIPKGMAEECALMPRDIIMSLTGNVGRVGLVYEQNALLNQRVLKLIPRNNDIAYVYALFRSEYMRKTMEKIATGTSQKNLSPVEVSKLNVILPDEAVLKKFASICNKMIFKMVDKMKENEELVELRDFILPIRMRGEI